MEPIRIVIRRVFHGDGTSRVDKMGYCATCQKSHPLDEPSKDRGKVQPERSPRTTPVSAIMTRDIVCVSPDFSVESLATLFLERGIHAAPVVDELGRLMGFVSMTDIIREQHDNADTDLGSPGTTEPALRSGFHLEPLARATVGEVMTLDVLALHENTHVAQAAALMAFEGVYRVPIISGSGEVVGILSALDVLRWLAGQDGHVVPFYTQLQRGVHAHFGHHQPPPNGSGQAS
jgi:CBS domain-containing protein